MASLKLSFDPSRLLAYTLTFAVLAGFLGQTVLIWTGYRFSTLILAIALLGFSTIVVVLRKSITVQISYRLFVSSLFFIFVYTSLLWTTSTAYANEKVLAFFACFFIYLAASVLPSNFHETTLKVFFTSTVVIFLISVLGLVSKSQLFYSLGASERSIYLSAGYYGGAALVLLGWMKWFKSRFAFSLLVTVLCLGLLVTGARGPLIFSIFIFILGLTINRQVSKLIIIIILSTLSSLALGFLLQLESTSFLLERSFDRFGLLFDKEFDSRSDLWDSISLWQSNEFSMFFGHGVGSFGIEYFGFDERAYPHNIFLELLVELGLIGFLLFMIPLCFGFISAVRYFRSPIISAYSALLIYELFNLMKSFTLSDARTLFFVLGILIGFRAVSTSHPQIVSYPRE
ncbi:O-antigen ligase [Nitrosomonas nitrosa]|uniref:O-antigen ligase n=1 Tax=Nitrosomonas nitrosa TaxID=52442 RepID=A0A1I4RXY6_9PROT|nr:O-antigen ligase family protein [Nitrosomonas nitrosa]SFM57088.1 O-antigen ligase [Nitrosomonas nitrosa]